MIQRSSGVDFSTLRFLDGGESTLVALFSKNEKKTASTLHSPTEKLRVLTLSVSTKQWQMRIASKMD
jgi:hypothetical protein